MLNGYPPEYALAGQAKTLGSNISEQQMLSFSREMIEETQRKQLA